MRKTFVFLVVIGLVVALVPVVMAFKVDESRFPGDASETYLPYIVKVPPPTCPDLVAFTGDITELANLPASVAKDRLTGNTVYIFEEFESEVTDLPLDITGGTYTGPACSYYVHLDAGEDGARIRLDGSFTFSENVAGLIVAGSVFPDGGPFSGQNTLCATNSVLQASGVDYGDGNTCGTGGDNRGLEVGPDYTGSGSDDNITLSGNTVEFSLLVAPQGLDAFRVILPLSP